MAPMVAAILGAAAAGAVYLATRDKGLDPKTLPLVDPKNNPGLVSSLQYGRTYSVICMVDLSKVPVEKTQKIASDLVRSFFTQEGFNVRSEPKPVTDMDKANLAAGLPASFTFVGQWTKTSSAMANGHPAIPTAQFFILPMA